MLQYGRGDANRQQVNGQAVGRKIQYRYVDAVLAEEPLRPWQMNERIKKAIIQSVYDDKGGLDGKGDIELTKIVFELGGVTMASELFIACQKAGPNTIQFTTAECAFKIRNS